MNFTEKIKKTALGLAVLGLAVATSAFTNRVAADGYLTNNGTDYDYRAELNGTCEPAENQCAYKIVSASQVDPSESPFSPSEVADLLQSGAIELIGEKGVFEEYPAH